MKRYNRTNEQKQLYSYCFSSSDIKAYICLAYVVCRSSGGGSREVTKGLGTDLLGLGKLVSLVGLLSTLLLEDRNAC